MENYIVRRASLQDVSAIVNLLAKGDMQVQGIEPHVDNFVVIEDMRTNRIVATGGIEESESTQGLLRSLALDPAANLGSHAVLELLRTLLVFARQKGIHDLYLITSSITLFEFIGFQTLDWVDVPSSIQRSNHFQQAKTDTSMVMHYTQVVG